MWSVDGDVAGSGSVVVTSMVWLGKAEARLASVAERDSGASGLRLTRRVDATGVAGGVESTGMVEVVAIDSRG
jgi:hypothetical protein